MSLKGISIEQPTGRRVFTNPVGLRGISFETPSNIRLIKVVDFRGNPFPNAKVTIHNSGGDFVVFTNQNGLAEILPDTVGTVLFDVEQYKTIQTGFSYTYASELPTKTVKIQSSTSHI